MKHKRRTKRALINSVISLFLCFSMLIGTTFAWFTDSVTSGYNIIQAGTLDIELEYLDANKEWQSVTEATKLFDENALWEPGYTEVAYLRISNKGNLALKYQLGMTVASETGSVNAAGKAFTLSDYIEFEAIKNEATPYADRDAARKAVTNSAKLSAGYVREDELLVGAEPHYVALVAFMPESVGNEVNHATGTAAPKIQMGISLFATQQMAEKDSFGDNYDSGSAFPKANVNVSVASPVTNNVDNGVVVTPIAVGNEGSGIAAKIPEGVALAEGATEVTLSVKSMENSEANIEIEDGKVTTSLDVHIDGVAENNTVPMLITLDNYLMTGLNSTSVELYHVEDGNTVEMTQVNAPDEPDAHNEFSYDPATGTVVLALASFSEVAVVADVSDPWQGSTANGFSKGSGTESEPYVIANAEQFAYFRNQVDGGESYKDKFIVLAKDINLNKINFEPIGWGYENSTHNRNGVDGKPFEGTFDGAGHTIYGLYQNGWDLENDEKDYTYTNCGFGLFASVSDGTIKNLTINGADIRVECVEAGILVGLSQGNCTYENINICDSKIANYQRPAGGVVGEVSGGGTHTFKGVNVRSDVVVGSMWGDFDTPVGGVVGARWDDTSNNDTKVEMSDVTVACKLDVYNDVTSTYQWYAYRRAGMLIGNTDTPPANGKEAQTATADFLTCDDSSDEDTYGVVVHYGDWVDYHYCEFNNYEPSWPWVRVEAGENCDAFSNPRYGVPNDDDGNKVTSLTHKHSGNDKCNVLISFNQLYGGGQGVYGQPAHGGVVIADYSVTYMDRGKVFAVDYGIIENGESETYTVNSSYKPTRTDIETDFKAWVNAGGSVVETSFTAEKGENYVLYDSWDAIYTARFVDQKGQVLKEEEFTNTNYSDSIELPEVSPIIIEGAGTFTPSWGVYDDGEWITDLTTIFKNASGDVTIVLAYEFDGELGLIPVDDPKDGIIEYYKVVATNEITSSKVVIPGDINGVPVTTIDRIHNEDGGKDWNNYNKTIEKIEVGEGVKTIGNNGLAYTPNLAEVWLPSTLEKLGKNAFSRNDFWGNDKKAIIIHFNGPKEQWDQIIENSPNGSTGDYWGGGLEKGTQVICTDGTYTRTSNTTRSWDWTPKSN